MNAVFLSLVFLLHLFLFFIYSHSSSISSSHLCNRKRTFNSPKFIILYKTVEQFHSCIYSYHERWFKCVRYRVRDERGRAHSPLVLTRKVSQHSISRIFSQSHYIPISLSLSRSIFLTHTYFTYLTHTHRTRACALALNILSLSQKIFYHVIHWPSKSSIGLFNGSQTRT